MGIDKYKNKVTIMRDNRSNNQYRLNINIPIKYVIYIYIYIYIGILINNTFLT